MSREAAGCSERNEELGISQAEPEKDIPIEKADEGGDATAVAQEPAGPPYSIFTEAQKRWIVFLATIAAFFSPFSSTIYLPALLPVQKDLGISSTEVNLSLTTYLIFQAIAPTFTGELSDSLGRRPVYLISMTIYVGACVGLALQKSLVALLLLRMLQSSGSSGTIAIGFGSIADISTSAERGKYVGMMNAFPLSSPALGPVIGGAIAERAGWRWIFWFLVIFSAVAVALMALGLPETNRKIVGNGSIPPSRLNRAPLQKLVNPLSRDPPEGVEVRKRTKRDLIPNPFRSVLIMFNKDVSVILFVMSLYYAAFYAVNASLPKLFSNIYGYNDLEIGLCYFSFGVGAILASVANGKIIDRDFRIVAETEGITVDRKNMTDMAKFPLERARLRSVWYSMVVYIVAIVPYGWALQYGAHVAVPLVLLFIQGFTAICVVNTVSIFLVDLYPAAPATATASGNLSRCMFGALSTSVVDIMLDNLGIGWTFTFWGLICIICFPFLHWDRHYGYKSRIARYEALIKKQGAEKRRPEQTNA
ncbi:hypothetical protein Dda_6501 [Drechslerella dactyloides]|uniref:Major facilitator superfamily (MFS) profile domain-containing protein n=1 Tax=Drechslerella dactyloides TaxID=74499 RepID=A0AAD6NHH0_DREDA|nr:hypothetical protein Dda_6501 [Drechslerella dactyloides]